MHQNARNKGIRKTVDCSSSVDFWVHDGLDSYAYIEAVIIMHTCACMCVHTHICTYAHTQHNKKGLVGNKSVNRDGRR